MSTAIDLFRGDDRLVPLALTEDGSAMDLTDADVRFTAKRSIFDADDDAFLSKTLGDGLTIDTDPTTGIVALEITADDTADLTLPERFRYDVQVTRADAVRTVMTGRLSVRLDVSRTAP